VTSVGSTATSPAHVEDTVSSIVRTSLGTTQSLSELMSRDAVRSQAEPQMPAASMESNREQVAVRADIW
jgi:hypothetical protein